MKANNSFMPDIKMSYHLSMKETFLFKYQSNLNFFKRLPSFGQHFFQIPADMRVQLLRCPGQKIITKCTKHVLTDLYKL